MSVGNDSARQAAEETQVWATQFFRLSRYIFSVEVQRCGTRMGLFNEYHWAKPLDPGRLPTSLCVRKGPVPKLDLFSAMGGVMVVSARLAALLAEFDLGPAPTREDPAPRRVELHPLPLLGADGTTKLADVAVLQVSNHKDGWLPEQSKIFARHDSWDGYSVTVTPGSLAVDHRALGGADLWRDPRAPRALFLSGRLVAAMREAGMAGLEEIHPCRMVGIPH